MSIVDFVGFSRLEREAQGIVQFDPNVTFNAGVPADSLASRSLDLANGGCRIPFYNGDQATIKESSGGDWAFHARVYHPINTNTNDDFFFGVQSVNPVVRVYGVSSEDNTAQIKAIVGAASFTQGADQGTNTGAYWLVGDWNRLIYHKQGSTFRIYLNGLLVAVWEEVVVVGGGNGDPREWLMMAGNGNQRVTDCVFMDLDGSGVSDLNDLINCTVAPVTFTGDGAVTNQTGAYTDVDEVPPNDSDYIEATAVDQLQLMTQPGVAVPIVLDVKMYARVTRLGTDAGQSYQFAARQGAGGVDVFVPAVAGGAPGDGQFIATFGHLEPDGAAWTPALLATTQFGVVSRT